jgi:NAD(P)-dependent dehydrogenase (short-subunit alcohol dehydrogenase family)
LLEEAKLQRMPKPKPLSGRVALITGSGGGIGKAIAKKFAAEGACVIINDINTERMESAMAEFRNNSDAMQPLQHCLTLLRKTL